MTDSLLRPAHLLEDEYGLHLLPLAVLCLRKIGSQYITWQSSVLREELEEEFGTIGPATWSRIQAVRLMQANSAFWSEWEVFEKVTAAAVGQIPIFSHAQPPEAEEMAISIYAASQIANHEYSEDVRGYAAAACLHDGLWYLEDTPLDIAEGAIRDHDDRKNIERDYGSVADVLSKTTGYIQEPDSMADVQANRVISVNAALTTYRLQVESQIKRIAGFGEFDGQSSARA